MSVRHGAQVVCGDGDGALLTLPDLRGRTRGVIDRRDILWESDRSLRVRVADAPHALAEALRGAGLGFVLDAAATGEAVHVVVDPLSTDADACERAILRLARDASVGGVAGRTHEIAVCYEPPHALDLAGVARETGLSEHEVVALHTSTAFTVAFLGFAPGFGYLDGVPETLRVPRLGSPRARVPAGSVGLAGPYTGVYALAGPGGWRVIGRTNAVLFDAGRAEPALLRAGDVVRFRNATAQELGL